MIPPDWDAWLVTQGWNAGFCQTSTWAAIHEAVNGARSFVLTADVDGKRRGGMLVSHRPAAPPRGRVGERARGFLSGRGRGMIECLEGPVLPERIAAEILADLLRKLDVLSTELGVRSIRFAGPPPLSAWAGSSVTSAVFRDFGYREVPWATAVVDLSLSEDALWSGIRHAARKGVRKCREAGLTVTQCRTFDDYVRDYREPYFAGLAAEGKRTPAQFNDAETWRIDAGRHYRFFAAKDKSGTVHATLGTYAFNGIATEIMSGRSAAGHAANLPAGDLLHWEIFLIHKAAGDSWFNLAGYNPAPRDAKEEGIRRFKQKWGGREVPVPQYLRGEPLAARIARTLFSRVLP